MAAISVRGLALTLALASLGQSVFSPSALAQGLYLEQVAPGAQRVVRGPGFGGGGPYVRGGPRVYGWSSTEMAWRGACGRFQYWNGGRCADARYEPRLR